MRIDFANLNLAYKEHKDAIDVAIQNVIDTSSFIMGHEIQILENKLSKFCGAKYSISCSNGTDALLLALMALDIGPGDEIITTPFTFISTSETISFLGAKPVFVDINEFDYNIDVEKIEEKITLKTKAILPVSLFGQTSDMDEINFIAEKYNIAVIEDAAQSFGANYKSKKSCNISTIATTSFFPAKPLGCFGDGGAVFTNNFEIAEKIKTLRLHGQKSRYNHKYIGIAGRLDTLQAAILNVKIEHYHNDIVRRQLVAENYSSKLSNFIKVPKVDQSKTSVWAQYTLRFKNRDFIQKKLKDFGIPTTIHYPIPLHLQECFKFLNYKFGDFPISEKISSEVLSLPINPYVTDQEQDYITSKIIKYI